MDLLVGTTTIGVDRVVESSRGWKKCELNGWIEMKTLRTSQLLSIESCTVEHDDILPFEHACRSRVTYGRTITFWRQSVQYSLLRFPTLLRSPTTDLPHFRVEDSR
jgi:hypothetical protein